MNGSCRFAAIFRALNVRAQVSALYWRSSDPSPRPSVMQKVRATAWDAEEIAKLTQKVKANGGVGNIETMRRIESEMPGRTARQLYDRWRSNAVNKRDFSTGWSEADDQQLLTRATVAGWTDISKEFDGTSAADVKNRWRYLMRQPVAPGGRSWDAGQAELHEKVLSEHHAMTEEAARKRRAVKAAKEQAKIAPSAEAEAAPSASEAEAAPSAEAEAAPSAESATAKPASAAEAEPAAKRSRPGRPEVRMSRPGGWALGLDARLSPADREAAEAKAKEAEQAERQRKLDEVQRLQQAGPRAQEAAAAAAAAEADAAEGTRLARGGDFAACQRLLEQVRQRCGPRRDSYCAVAHAIATVLYAYLETHPEAEAEAHAELFQRLLAAHAEVPEEQLARRVNERLALVPEPLLTDQCGTDDWLVRGELRAKAEALLREREWAAKEAFLLSLVSANNPVTRATAAVVAEILSQKPTAEMVNYAHLKEGKAAFLKLASHHSPEHADLYITLFTLVDFFDCYTRAIKQLEVYTRRQLTEGELTALLESTSVSTLGAGAAGMETFLPCSPWYDRTFGPNPHAPAGGRQSYLRTARQPRTKRPPPAGFRKAAYILVAAY